MSRDVTRKESRRRRFGAALAGIALAATISLAGLAAAPTATPFGPVAHAEELAAVDPLAAMEGELLALVNADRAAAGLAPLAADPQLAAVARWRSKDMADRDYFSHDIGGYRVFQVLRDHGLAYRVAGENLAFNTYPAAETVARAEAALMNSPSHRANILRPDFTHAGVGVALAPDGKVLYTQLFTAAW